VRAFSPRVRRRTLSFRFKLSARQVKQISLVFDADGSGQIDYQEFARFCSLKDVSDALAASKAIKTKKKRCKASSPAPDNAPPTTPAAAVRAPAGKAKFSPAELEVRLPTE